jgi:hypothetical protein
MSQRHPNQHPVARSKPETCAVALGEQTAKVVLYSGLETKRNIITEAISSELSSLLIGS